MDKTNVPNLVRSGHSLRLFWLSGIVAGLTTLTLSSLQRHFVMDDQARMHGTKQAIANGLTHATRCPHADIHQRA
jgi:hypothetical protein